jgi:transcriptional regulator GlxA family with amidase domain
MLRNVAVVVVNGFLPFEFGTICEVFGVDRADDGLPSYDFAVVAGEPAPLRAHNNFTIQPSCGLERLEEADLIALPAVGDDRLSIYAGRVPPSRPPRPPELRHPPREFPGDLLAALRRAVDRGARVLSVCSGAFILGEAGLLDGRRCTTHWRHAEELARRYPAAKVDPDVLYVDDDPVITSAGTAAGIDACLYLVRKEQGSRVANGIARRMVVPPHRDGGQAQYVDQPVAPSCDGTLRDLLEWLRAHLEQPLTVRQLAVRANMSERTFARRFVQDTGTTPQRWLTGQRILLAQQLLEESDETVDAIADRTGFGNATALRHHFRAWRGTTPHAYRRIFRGDPPARGARGPRGVWGGGQPPHNRGVSGGRPPESASSPRVSIVPPSQHRVISGL